MELHLKLGTKEQDMQKFRKMLKDSKGATAIEYGLIAALIAVAAVTTVGTVGTNLNGTFGDVATNLD
jgi:pilus assembly protein Flp/PilA